MIEQLLNIEGTVNRVKMLAEETEAVILSIIEFFTCKSDEAEVMQAVKASPMMLVRLVSVAAEMNGLLLDEVDAAQEEIEAAFEAYRQMKKGA